jgi:hypothetical protein
MKKKTTPRNYLVKLALFRKAGVHRKSNKAMRRLEKSKKNYYSEAHLNLNRSGLVSRNLYGKFEDLLISSFHLGVASL